MKKIKLNDELINDVEIGIVFVKPWNYPGPWCWPRFVTSYTNGRVAISVGRAALVFNIAWWRKWKPA